MSLISLHMRQPHLWVKASHVHVFGGTITVNFRYTSLHDFVKIAQTTLAHSYLYRWHWTTFSLWLLWNIDPVNWTFHVDGTWTWSNVFLMFFDMYYWFLYWLLDSLLQSFLGDTYSSPQATWRQICQTKWLASSMGASTWRVIREV